MLKEWFINGLWLGLVHGMLRNGSARANPPPWRFRVMDHGDGSWGQKSGTIPEGWWHSQAPTDSCLLLVIHFHISWSMLWWLMDHQSSLTAQPATSRILWTASNSQHYGCQMVTVALTPPVLRRVQIRQFWWRHLWKSLFLQRSGLHLRPLLINSTQEWCNHAMLINDCVIFCQWKVVGGQL